MVSCEKRSDFPLVRKLLKELFPEVFVVWEEKGNFLAVFSPKVQVVFHNVPQTCAVVTIKRIFSLMVNESFSSRRGHFRVPGGNR